MPRPPRADFLAALQPLLDPSIVWNAGEDGPPCEVLVEGVPDRARIEASPDLRAVVIPYAGVPARTRELIGEFEGVSLHNLHHNAAPTAEMALALFLAAAKAIVPLDRTLRQDDWRPRYEERDDLLCDGGTALVLGYGAIGRRIAAGCRGLGMRVLAIRRAAPKDPESDEVEIHGPDALPELLPRLTALFVAVPWTPKTEGLLDRAALARLPDGAVLVNIARGPVVDETALFEELSAGRLAAGLDVWYRYPEDEASRADTAPAGHPFGDLDNVVLSPHRAGLCAGIEALRAQHLAELLNCAARGKPLPNRVELGRGY